MVMDMKKRLTSFLPSSARAQLQNVLTVEWDTHKTVLVEVPGAGSSRSNDVEMSGMVDRTRSDYGRLDDEDDYEERSGLFNGSSSRTRDWQDESRADRRGQRGSLKKKPQPHSYRTEDTPDDSPEEDNPFDENSPSYRSALDTAPPVPPKPDQWARQESTTRRKLPPLSEPMETKPRKQVSEWQTFDKAFEVDRKGQKVDAWAESGGWSQTTSPTSSRGTRESAQLEAEDPFA